MRASPCFNRSQGAALSELTFIDEVSEGTPTPGGGAAAAYVGALGSALNSMVGNLTVGKKSYADVEDDVKACLVQLQEVRDQLIDLMDRDAQAFAPLAASFKMPRGTEEEKEARRVAMQEALIDAIEVPLAIVKACARVVELSDFMAHHGSKMALSDVATGVSFAKGALKGAALNIFVNAKMLEDRARAKRYTDEAECLIIEWGKRADDIYIFVLEGLR